MLRKKTILIQVYTLMLLGIIFLSTSSLFEAELNLNNQLVFLKKQLIWLCLGSLSMFFWSRISTQFTQKISFFLYCLSIIFLILLLIPGFSSPIFGSHRWLFLGPISFQPTEIFKFSSILFFSHLLSKPINLREFLFFLSIPSALILFQPDFSSVFLVNVIIISLYFFSQNNLANLVKIVFLLTTVALIAILSSPYRLARLTKNYHSEQLIISFASGSLFGKGIGNSTQKYKFLPQVSTDSILAIIGEEVGFLGITYVFLLFYRLIVNISVISQNCQNQFEKIVSMGLACWIFYQVLINVSVVLGLIPLTGIPLPFVSYGGSSIITLMSLVGIVNRISTKDLDH